MMNDDPYITQGYHGNYVPRAVCVDLEPGVVNNIKVDQFFLPKTLLINWIKMTTSTRLLPMASSSAQITLFGERMGLATAGLKATTQR